MSDKIQKSQEALVSSHMRTIKALKDSLGELHAAGLIRPFRISLAVSKDQVEQINNLQQNGQSVRQIAAKTGIPKSTVSDRTKKPSNTNGKSVRPDMRFGGALAAADAAFHCKEITEEIVTAAYDVAQAWQRAADHLREALNGKEAQD